MCASILPWFADLGLRVVLCTQKPSIENSAPENFLKTFHFFELCGSVDLHPGPRE